MSARFAVSMVVFAVVGITVLPETFFADRGDSVEVNLPNNKMCQSIKKRTAHTKMKLRYKSRIRMDVVDIGSKVSVSQINIYIL
jgi:hypothetical protein